METEELRGLVADVRTRLADLVPDPAERAEVDARLAGALAGDKDALLAAIRADPRTSAVLEADTDRTVDLSGDVTATLGVLFYCPNKDYAVVREVVADEVPTCPHDGAVLLRHQAAP
jgi:hypothetical protein